MNTMRQFVKSNRLPIGLFCAVFIIFIGTLKFTTTPASDNTVEQWVNLTNQMFYGDQDFMFSYGPMFWLTGGSTNGFPSSSSAYSRTSYVASMVYASSVYALFWALLLSLVVRHKSYILFPLVFALFFRARNLVGPFYLLPIIFVYYLEYAKPSRIVMNYKLIIAVGLYIGALFYVRFFYGLMGAVTVGSYFVSRILADRTDRGVCYFLPSLIAGYLITGLIIFHHKLNVFTYLIINSQLNYGNSVDMTLDVTNKALTFVLLGVALVLLNIHLFRTNRSLILTINGLYMIFVKMGFSRADGGHFIYYYVIPAVVLSLVLLFREKLFNKLLFVAFIATICWISHDPAKRHTLTYTPFTFGSGIDYEVEYPDRMASSYSMYKLPDSMVNRIGQATIDVYTYNNEYMFANRLNYHYRPSFQNYMTLTPKLDRMNQKFFEGDNKPQFVLWTENLWGFDNKYPLSEDPLTSSSIFLNYHMVDKAPGRYGGVILLERNRNTAIYRPNSIKTQEMEFDKWYEVPTVNSGVVKLVPNLKLTAFAKAKNLLFRGNILYVNYKLASGEIKRYRQNVLNSESGIWVSPFFVSFKFVDERVVAVMLETDSGYYFEPKMTAEWISIPINIMDLATADYEKADRKEVARQFTVKVDPKYRIQCHLDRYAKDVDGGLQVYGWAFIRGRRPDQTTTYLVLVDRNDEQYCYRLREHSRPDVTACFKNGVNLDMAGFSDTIPADQVPQGPLKVSLYLVNNADGHGAIKEFANR